MRSSSARTAFSISSHCGLDRRLEVAAGPLRAVEQLDREHLARHVQYGARAEEGREFLPVQRGRRDEQPQRRRARPREALEEAEEDVRVEAPLVGFVEDDHRVPAQLRILQALAQQAAVGEVFDARGVRHAVLEAHGVADLAAQGDAHLAGHPPRNRHCGHAAGLRDGNGSLLGKASTVQKLGKLRRFP